MVALRYSTAYLLITNNSFTLFKSSQSDFLIAFFQALLHLDFQSKHKLIIK